MTEQFENACLKDRNQQLQIQLNDAVSRCKALEQKLADTDKLLSDYIKETVEANQKLKVATESNDIMKKALEEIYFPNVPYSRTELDKHSKDELISIVQQDIDYARNALAAISGVGDGKDKK